MILSHRGEDSEREREREREESLVINLDRARLYIYHVRSTCTSVAASNHGGFLLSTGRRATSDSKNWMTTVIGCNPFGVSHLSRATRVLCSSCTDHPLHMGSVHVYVFC